MMKRRTPKVLLPRKKPSFPHAARFKRVAYYPVLKTRREKVFDVIYDASRRGYRFADSYYGIPFVELNDIEETGNGIYVVRFRCEPQYMRPYYFETMAKRVCAELRSRLHFAHEAKMEFGMPYEECVWIIQIGEIDNELPIWRRLYMSETKIKAIEKEQAPHPRKCTHERWEDFLQTHYNRSLASVARELGYSEQNLDLLECNGEDAAAKKAIYKKYRGLFDAFLKDERNKALVDGRNVLDYFKDLIASWVGEDLLVRALNEYGFTASLANADSDRVIKTKRVNVTGEPDIKVELEGNVRYLELMDALSPVERYGQIDLRLDKAKNQFNRKTLFLLHGLADGKYLLVDFLRDNITVTYNCPNPRYGNKPSSIVSFKENGIQMQDMAVLWETLKDTLRNTKPEPEGHYLKLVDHETGKEEVLRAADGEDAEPTTEAPSEPQKTATPPLEAEHETEIAVPTPIPDAGPEEEAVEEPKSIETDEESSVIEEDENGDAVEYSPEQWAALNEGF